MDETIKRWNRDRYIAHLFAPDHLQPHLINLYGFAAEIARIPHLVSEAQIGDIRLQWWIDTLDTMEQGHQLDHPVAQALAETIRKFELPTSFLVTFVEAHRAELYADQFPDLLSLEAFIAETEAAISQFAAMILDKPAAASASATIGLASAAYGLARLTSRPQLEAKFIPPGQTLESLRQLAMQRLTEARRENLPSKILPAVLPATLTELYLNGTPSALRCQWRLWRAAKSGRI